VFTPVEKAHDVTPDRIYSVFLETKSENLRERL
jgi:hypothetical protein